MIKEVLQKDSIHEVEKILGKHHSEFTEDENMFMLGKVMLDNKLKESVLKSSRDTYYSIEFNEFIDIIESYGFTLSFSYTFPYEKTHEVFAIYCHEELGLVLKLTSFWGGKRINTAECFGMLKYVDWDDLRGVYMGSNGPLNTVENSRFFALDAREGFIYKLEALRQVTHLYPVWPEKHTWMSLYDFMQARDVDSKNYTEKRDKDIYNKVKAGDNILKKIVDFKG